MSPQSMASGYGNGVFPPPGLSSANGPPPGLASAARSPGFSQPPMMQNPMNGMNGMYQMDPFAMANPSLGHQMRGIPSMNGYHTGASASGFGRMANEGYGFPAGS